MNKISIFLFTFLILASFTLAAPPQESTGGLQVTYPKEDVFIFGKVADFHYHIFDGNNYVVTNESTDCYMHLYNNTGNHLLEVDLSFDSNDIDFYYEVNQSIVTVPGQYTVIVWCNNTQDAGYLSYAVEFNRVGHSVDNGHYLALAVVFIIMFITLAYVARKINLFYFNEIPLVEHFVNILVLWLLVPLTNLLIEISELQYLGIVPGLRTVYHSIIVINIFVTSFWLLGLLAEILTKFGYIGGKPNE